MADLNAIPPRKAFNQLALYEKLAEATWQCFQGKPKLITKEEANRIRGVVLLNRRACQRPIAEEAFFAAVEDVFQGLAKQYPGLRFYLTAGGEQNGREELGVKFVLVAPRAVPFEQASVPTPVRKTPAQGLLPRLPLKLRMAVIVVKVKVSRFRAFFRGLKSSFDLHRWERSSTDVTALSQALRKYTQKTLGREVRFDKRPTGDPTAGFLILLDKQQCSRSVTAEEFFDLIQAFFKKRKKRNPQFRFLLSLEKERCNESVIALRVDFGS